MQHTFKYKRGSSGMHTYQFGEHHIEINKMRDGSGWMANHRQSGQDVGHGQTREGALNDAVNTLKHHGVIEKAR